MSANGSILSYFSYLELGTADDKHYTLKNTWLSKLGLKLIGLPHLGFRARARAILSLARQEPKNSRILDAGCGYGLYSMTLANQGYDNIDAIDLDPERTQAIRNRLAEYEPLKNKITVETGSLANLPLPDKTYDLIICSEVIEHMVEDKKAVSELARVLKLDGKLILSVPYYSEHNTKIFKKFGHERPGYTKESLTEIFKLNNLKLISASYYEYKIGTWLFDSFNLIKSPAIMAGLFYLWYGLYLLDQKLAWGEPNGIIVTTQKI